MKKLLFILSIAFCLNTNAQYTKLLDFNGINGGTPRSYLFFDGSFLYGTTQNGGAASNNGTIFKIKTDGSAYQNLHNFQGSGYGDGASPNNSFIFDGTFLYSTTSLGGMNNKGIIFKIKPDGTGYSNAHDFLNITPNGMPVFDGANFYGATGTGGYWSAGGILKTNLSLPNDTFSYSFNGNEGTNPFGSIIYDGTFIYGTTNQGGLNGKGVVFKVKPDGTSYDTLLNFSNVMGANPIATPYYDGTYLYGTTLNGGVNNMGTIYRVKPDGSGDTVLFNFSTANGYQSEGALIIVHGHLYGMTSYGGINDDGVVFKIKPDGTNYTKLFDFNNAANGNTPQSSLISDGIFLYGMTLQGGANGYGTIFKLKIPVITINQNTTICQGQSISVSNHTYNVTGTYADTLFSTSQDCDSIINTNLTVLSSSSSTSQSYTLCSGQSVNVGADIYTTSGTYTYTFNGGSCDSTVTTNLNVIPSPTVSISGNNSLCIGQSNTTTLTASGGGTYVWNTGSTDTSIIVSPLADTVYSVIATNGVCSDTTAVLVTVHQSPTVGFSSAVSTCCASNWLFTDTTHAVSGDPIASWDWTFSNGYPPTGSGQYTTTSLSGGNHTICLTVTTSHGCIDSSCTTIFSMPVEEFTNSLTALVYPNPTKQILNVELKTPGGTRNLNLQIVDVLGNIVIRQKVETEILIINISDLNEGVYNLTITNNSSFINKKIVITR